METPQSKDTKAKFELEKNNQKYDIELNIKKNKLEICITQENSIPSTIYHKDFL